MHSNERDSPRGWISRYAWGDDYHDVLGEKLELFMAALRERFGDQFAARTYVDTGPISRTRRRQSGFVAGIGWLGKNTCLINQEIGSWLFLCVIITSLPIARRRRKPRAEQPEKQKKERFAGRGLLGMTSKEEEKKKEQIPLPLHGPGMTAKYKRRQAKTRMRRGRPQQCQKLALLVDVLPDGPGEGPRKNSGFVLERAGSVAAKSSTKRAKRSRSPRPSA